MASHCRADHVGSLLRPQTLLAAREAFQRGEISGEQCRSAEDAAIRRVLEMQRQAGIEVFSDGEFRRSSWLGGFLDVAEGLVAPSAPGARVIVWHGEGEQLVNEGMTSLPVVGDRLRVSGRFTGAESAFLKANAPGPFKITMPSPTQLLIFFADGVSDQVYPNRQAMLDDLLAIYRSEIDGLIADGVPYIQIDSLRYIDLIDEQRRRAIDPGAMVGLLAQFIAADNAVLAGAKRPGVTRGVHICRGNHRSSWFGQGGYDSIAEALFDQLDADRFLLEYDDERSGSFEPLRFVPKHKVVVLGLVTTKSAKLESQDELMRRVEEASKFVPLENLALSPQCGFASTQLGNLLTEDDERRKLELVATTARRIWGEA